MQGQPMGQPRQASRPLSNGPVMNQGAAAAPASPNAGAPMGSQPEYVNPSVPPVTGTVNPPTGAAVQTPRPLPQQLVPNGTVSRAADNTTYNTAYPPSNFQALPPGSALPSHVPPAASRGVQDVMMTPDYGAAPRYSGQDVPTHP
jgi:hypothetical protein